MKYIVLIKFVFLLIPKYLSLEVAKNSWLMLKYPFNFYTQENNKKHRVMPCNLDVNTVTICRDLLNTMILIFVMLVYRPTQKHTNKPFEIWNHLKQTIDATIKKLHTPNLLHIYGRIVHWLYICIHLNIYFMHFMIFLTIP